MTDLKSYLMDMALANGFITMRDTILTLSKKPTSDDIKQVIEGYICDLHSFLNDLPENEYRTTIQKDLLDSRLIERILTMDLTHDISVSDTVSYFTSYRYIGYNSFLNNALGIFRRKSSFNSPYSKAIITLWAIYNLFVKGVVKDINDEKVLRTELSKYDRHFGMPAVTAGGMIMYHIRNAVVHGRIIFGNGIILFTDYDQSKRRKDKWSNDKGEQRDKIEDPFIGAITPEGLVRGFLLSMPTFFGHLNDNDWIIYFNIVNHLQYNPFENGLETNLEIACLTLLSNFDRYFEHDLEFYRNHCNNHDENLFFQLIDALGDMTAKDVRNAFAHNIHLIDNNVILDGEKTVSHNEFMAYNDVLKIVDDLLVLKCIAGSKDIQTRCR